MFLAASWLKGRKVCSHGVNGAFALIKSTAGVTMTHLAVHMPRTYESILIAGQPIKIRLCGRVKMTGKRRE